VVRREGLRPVVETAGKALITALSEIGADALSSRDEFRALDLPTARSTPPSDNLPAPERSVASAAGLGSDADAAPNAGSAVV
jgi:hypothetical protein